MTKITDPKILKPNQWVIMHYGDFYNSNNNKTPHYVLAKYLKFIDDSAQHHCFDIYHHEKRKDDDNIEHRRWDWYTIERWFPIYQPTSIDLKKAKLKLIK